MPIKQLLKNFGISSVNVETNGHLSSLHSSPDTALPEGPVIVPHQGHWSLMESPPLYMCTKAVSLSGLRLLQAEEASVLWAGYYNLLEIIVLW